MPRVKWAWERCRKRQQDGAGQRKGKARRGKGREGKGRGGKGRTGKGREGQNSAAQGPGSYQLHSRRASVPPTPKDHTAGHRVCTGLAALPAPLPAPHPLAATTSEQCAVLRGAGVSGLGSRGSGLAIRAVMGAYASTLAKEQIIRRRHCPTVRPSAR